MVTGKWEDPSSARMVTELSETSHVPGAFRYTLRRKPTGPGVLMLHDPVPLTVRKSLRLKGLLAHNLPVSGSSLGG